MATADGPLASTALAISAFRSDESVIRLLDAAFAPGRPRFGAVIVVDSLGSGAIGQAIAANGWAVDYHNAAQNLGSAGNLHLRLTTAARLNLDWCFAVNHDGEVDAAKVATLVSHGNSRPRSGAVYPQLMFDRTGGKLDSPRRGFGTYGILRGDDAGASDDPCSEVAWSSSNGALYSLAAIRDGVRLWPELWMGYEDLAIGSELQRKGWRQWLCRDVRVSDNYEYEPVSLLGRRVHLATKPSWYMYYHLRNLILIARGSGAKAVSWPSIAARGLVDVALILLYRDKKRERLRLLIAGVRDGLRGLSGQGPVP